MFHRLGLHRHHHHHECEEGRRHRGGRHHFGGEGEEHGRGGRGGRGGRHRLFEHGDLRLVLLALVARKPSHGYELIKAIEEASSGLYVPSPGVIYPTLTLLEEQDFLEPLTTGNGRKATASPPRARASCKSINRWLTSFWRVWRAPAASIIGTAIWRKASTTP